MTGIIIPVQGIPRSHKVARSRLRWCRTNELRLEQAPHFVASILTTGLSGHLDPTATVDELAEVEDVA